MGQIKLGEFQLAKVAFLHGYNVYYNEIGDDYNKFGVADPGRWVLDSGKVAEFAGDYDLIKIIFDENEEDIYVFGEEFKVTFSEELKSINKPVDHLLKHFISENITFEKRFGNN